MHEAARAASVASQLLAFLREPVRYRPRFIHSGVLPDGQFVFRFAQGKFPHGLMRDLPNDERARLREAANAFIRQVCFREGSSHYHTLCVPPDAGSEAIKEHYHLLMALIHPDRQDAAQEHWPTGCAQRVNRAYAVLSDDELRRGYDEVLRKSSAGATVEPEAQPQRPQAARSRARRRTGWIHSRFGMPLVVITPVVAALFMVQTWWVNDVPKEYSILEGAAPLEVSARWVRDALSSERPPRYMGNDSAAREPAVAKSAKAGEPRSFFGSLWKSWDRDTAPPPPEPVPADPAPPQKSRAARAPQPAAAPSAETVKVASAVPEAPAPRPTAAAVVPSAAPKVVQASAPSAAPESRVSTEDIEMLVARVVSYYEAGEADKLMGLLDPSETGFWQATRMRQEYLEFFRATRQRSLRVKNLAWRAADSSTRAKGEATVSAEYFDERGVQERKVEVEMDIALRDGKAKLTRLSLFPNDK